LPMARRVLVEERRWLSAEQFTETLSICQILPGGNIINMSVVIGQRFAGLLGALAALFGLMVPPTLIAIALGSFYARYSEHPVVQHLFLGLAAAAAGLLVATAAKIALPIVKKPLPLILAAITFLAVAVFRLPMWPTIMVMGPLSILAAWKFPS
jgi:chromate transporter